MAAHVPTATAASRLPSQMLSRPPMGRRLTRVLAWVVAALFLLSVVTVATVYYAWQQPATPADQAAGEVLVHIPPGAGAWQIGVILQRAGLKVPAWAFVAAARLTGLDRNLQAGDYAFTRKSSLRAVLSGLQRGAVITHWVTFPEGYTARQMAERLAWRGLLDPRRFLELVDQPEAVFAGQVPGELRRAPSLQGFLFPDTYEIYDGQDPAALIRQMVEEALQVARPLYAKSPLRDRYSLYQLVTLASLVEGEAMVDRERPIIAGVFLNRLQRGMYLQSCATVEYVLGHHKERLSLQDIHTSSPYNTYQNPGLPPGPINNPGKASLQAAMFPARVDYYYFVARGDGTHIFSRGYKAHLLAQRQVKAGRSGR